MPESFVQMASLLPEMFGKTCKGLPFFSGLVVAFVISLSSMSILLTVFSEIKKSVHRKVFYEKYTIQLSEITVIICAISFIVQICFLLMHSPFVDLETEGHIIKLFKELYKSVPWIHALSPSTLLLSFTFLLFIFSSSYCFLWKKAKNCTVFRQLVLILSFLVAVIAIFIAFTFSFPIQKLFEPFALTPTVLGNQFVNFFSSSPFILASFLWICATGLVATSLVLGIWLILRRNKVNFGRDYYIFAMKFFARTTLGTLLFCILSLALLSYTFTVSTQVNGEQIQAINYLSLYASIIVVITILISRIALSSSPMRYKVTVPFSFLLFCFASFLPICGLFLMVNV